MDFTRYMSCELKVDTGSPGWYKTMRKMFGRIKEVTYNIDAQTGIVRVTGRINPRTLLKLLEKAGKHATLIKVDSGQAQPPVDEYGPDMNGQIFEPPAPLPPPLPYHHSYSNPGFQHQPQYIYHYQEPDTCCIM